MQEQNLPFFNQSNDWDPAWRVSQIKATLSFAPNAVNLLPKIYAKHVNCSNKSNERAAVSWPDRHYLNLDCLLLNCFLLLRSFRIFEASNAVFAEATFFAFCTSTCAPQYGHVLVLWPWVAIKSPPHLLQVAITQVPIRLASERLYLNSPIRVSRIISLFSVFVEAVPFGEP